MQKLSSAEIRNRYLRFFERHGHTIVPSSSLVVADDPTLLFANSGMVQFKNLFLGLEKRPYTRATTSQKCLRVSGKHNDLDEVGPSPRHNTFFEMLGNFSFGDYFKETAIPLSWKLLTEEFQLPVERLWFTVFKGDAEVAADDEAAELWVKAGADPSRVLRFDRKDNFWVMGDTGPCGPCSEITVYIGDDLSKMRPDGVNSDDPDYVEIWNNVFMQYDRATMQKLAAQSVDTGMGLERISMVLQGVRNIYDTDLFRPLIETTMAELGSDEAHYRANFAPYRAVADHARAIAFLMAEGVTPKNTGRNYVLRRILRRAAYQGRLIGFERPFLASVVGTVINQMGDAYPELRQKENFILEATDAEERTFLRTLTNGISLLNTLIKDVKASAASVIPGEEAFKLKDTYGFPLDLTEKIALAEGLTVDHEGFEQATNRQREIAQAAGQFKRGADVEAWGKRNLPPTTFTGYSELSGQGSVLALVSEGDEVRSAEEGAAVQVVLNQTPFYAESGGQVGDTGLLLGPHGSVRVEDTQRPVPGVIVHFGTVETGSIGVGETVTAQVDGTRRADIQRNHTATHMLHRALRDVLGEHAAQAGSLVAPERLRFDFTHTRAIDAGQLREIEGRINAWVRADGAVHWEVTDQQSALNKGAMALFGEKYGDQVRVVTVERGTTPLTAENAEHAKEQRKDSATSAASAVSSAFASRDSLELCGGTHVSRTGEIGFVRILSEGNLGGGLRRIEALTGRGAEAWAETQAQTVRDLAAKLGVPPTQVTERVEALLAEHKQRQQELEKLQGQLSRGSLEQLLDQVQRNNGVPLLVARVEASDANRLREMGDWLRDKLGSAVIVLGTQFGDKPQLLAVVTPDLVQQGYHAGTLVKGLAQLVGGGGGGRPEMALAGGKDSGKLDEALAQAATLVAQQKK